MGLLVVVGGAIAMMLVALKSKWQAGVTRASVRQDLQTTLLQMAQEMRNSEAALVTDGTAASPVAFSFPSAYDARGAFITDASGGAVWQKFVVYYVPTGTSRLLRKEVYQLPTLPPIQQTLAELTASCDGKGTLVSDSTHALTLAADGERGACTVGLTLRSQSRHGKTEETSQSLYVLMRN